MKFVEFINGRFRSLIGKAGSGIDEIDSLAPEIKPDTLPGPFARSLAIGRYSFDDFHKRTDMGKLIHLMKYHYSRKAADRLTIFLINYLQENPLPDQPGLVVTLPDSLTNRPFRPTAYLADAFGTHFGWPVRHDIIHPIRLEKPQKDRSFEERLADTEPRYDLRHPEAVTGKKVLLFDDIYATGRSLIEAADLINAHSPESLMALTLVKLGRGREQHGLTDQ